MLRSTTLIALYVVMTLSAVAMARSNTLRCYIACKQRHNPPDCHCERRLDCSTKVCGEMESCQMYLGRIPQCVKYKAACDLEKSLIPCERGPLRYYFDKASMRCSRVPRGQCPDNANSFRSMRQCSSTCYVRHDMDEQRGGSKRWGVGHLRGGVFRNGMGVYRSSG